MNNKKIFNIKQYYQSFKQLKMIGIIFTVICLLISVFSPISDALALQTRIDAGVQDVTIPIIVNVVRQQSFLYLTFIIFTPILTLYAWNFLTKRANSDFIHSLPYTRKCTYISNLVAVVSWQFLCLFLSYVGSTIVYAILSKYYVVDFFVQFRVVIAIFACNLLCAAGITIACMVTGTVFSNVCVTGLILFFPRIITSMMISAISSSVQIISRNHFLPLLDNNYNLVTSLTGSFMGRGLDSSVVLSAPGLIYTLVLALLYFLLGAILFIKRKSETAGKGASNRILQTLIRVVIGFTVCAFGMIGAIDNLRNDTTPIYNVIYTIAITFIIAAVVIMTYECICTKSIRCVTKCFKSIGITYGVSILFFFALNMMISGIIQYRPAPEDVKYITFEGAGRQYYGGDYKNYFEECSSAIKIDDPVIKETLMNALSDNIDVIKESNKQFWNYISSNELQSYTVKIKSGLFSTYRDIYLTPEQIELIVAKLNNVEEFRAAYLDLPKVEETSISISGKMVSSNDREIYKDVYNQLLIESKEISFMDWYKCVQSVDSNVMILVSFTRDGVMYKMNIPMDKYLPKTYALYLKKVNDYNLRLTTGSELISVLKDAIDGKENKAFDRVEMIFTDPVSDTENNVTLNEYMKKYGKNTEKLQKIKECIVNAKEQKIDITKPYIAIDYYSVDNMSKASTKNSVTFYVQISEYNTIGQYYK